MANYLIFRNVYALTSDTFLAFSEATPSRYVDPQRVIAIADVLAYQRSQRERAQKALRQMRDEADEIGLYQ